MKTKLAIGLTVLILIITAAKTGGANPGREDFLMPMSVSANSSDNSCWATDTGQSEVVHLASDGRELWRSPELASNFPVSVSVNPTDGSCWIAYTGINAILHLNQDGELIWAGGYTDFSNPQSVSVNSSDGSCWVADTGNNEVVHLSFDGRELSRTTGFALPLAVSVNPTDGSCWVVDTDNSQVVRLAGKDGKVLWRGGFFLVPVALSVNPTDGSCWVADWGPSNDSGGSVYSTVVHLAATGEELWRAKSIGSNMISAVSVQAADGSCWVADWGPAYPHEDGYWYESRIIHLSADGTELWHGDGFNAPYSVSVNSSDGSCWVADYYNNRIVHLKITVDFADVPSTYWAFNQIEACFHQGIVQGYPGRLYQPAAAVSRDQMAVYIARGLAGSDALVPAGPPEPHFADIPKTSWAYKYVEFVFAQAVVLGYPDGNYEPSNPVSRDQMAVFISRAIVPPAYRPNLSNFFAPSNASFPDVPPTHWAYKYIEYCRAWDVVQGYSDGYRPNEITTRDQMAVYIQRAFDLPMY